ncbi:hypothetical protein EYF80_055258 [Liparis tanakae]|uniref:Uncharacterized protein n=1 Tax=Liparis tanakae TaxID=230148 RepID=A0A4Z2F039_9TELE|nr:hypothetical protein EYF80_055258 [Liparis tanakae]
MAVCEEGEEEEEEEEGEEEEEEEEDVSGSRETRERRVQSETETLDQNQNPLHTRQCAHLYQSDVLLDRLFSHLKEPEGSHRTGSGGQRPGRGGRGGGEGGYSSLTYDEDFQHEHVQLVFFTLCEHSCPYCNRHTETAASLLAEGR